MLTRLCFYFLLLLPFGVMGQQPTNDCRWVHPSSEGVQLDSLSILPSSIQLSGADSLPSVNYGLSTGLLKFGEGKWPDSVLVCYKVLPYALHHTYQHRSLDLYDSTALYDFPVEEKAISYLKEELFASDSLEKRGSISRGISFGNRQNVFVQSVLNLQLEGKLTDEINIRAAISDQNVPYQPEGNTQRLQEFDKVFIELYNEGASLIAGDIVLEQEEGYFLKYLKNVQGVQVTTSRPLLGLGPSRTSAGVALAKGKFASVQLNPIEGLSGPYQLPGPTGQRFVMVLSNSEKVYLDGRLLKRGFNYDYTIDYNLGEITFNPGIILTPYSRIRVDYEYSDRQYSRSTFNASHTQQLGALEVFSHFYQEKDSRNQPLSGELSEEEKLQLSIAGEEEGVYLPAIDSIGYSEDLLLYRKVDTVDASGYPLTYYKFSSDPAQAAYQLSFAEVGSGRGNYVPDAYIGTGRVYRYVPPVNGLPQGNFEPIRFISAPTQLSMLTGGMRLQLDEHQEVYTELAVSGNDRNLFAEGEESPAGVGVKSGYRMKGRPSNFDKEYRWSAFVDYELTNKNFSSIDRFRPLEFDREWGLASAEASLLQVNSRDELYNDHILSAGGALEKNTFNGLTYRIAGRQKGKLVNGWQQEVLAKKRFGLLQLNGQHFYLSNQQAEKEVHWTRWQGEAALHFNHWVPGYRYIVDRQATRQQKTDSLLSTLMNFREHQLFLHNGTKSLSKFSLLYSHRLDQLPEEGEFEKATLAHTVTASYASRELKGQQLSGLTSYRHSKSYIDSLGRTENVLSGQLNWQGRFWKNTLRSELIYTLGTGRELRRDFVYVKVPTGEGTHTWRDENGNGIQELGEFYEAINPDEKEYLRIFVPNNEFILANSSELNYRLHYAGIAAWSEAGGLKKIIGNFSGNVSWRSGKKSTEETLWSRFVPVAEGVADNPELLSTRQLLQLNLFYNRSNLRWGLEGSMLLQDRKQLLSAGFEAEEREQYRLGYRYNMGRSWGFRLRLEEEKLANYSEYLNQQQYLIYSHEAGPELNWTPGPDFQATLEASIAQKENKLNSEVAKEALLLDTHLSLRYSRLGNTLVQGMVRQVQIDFEGEPNSPAGYAMLEALQPGKNWLWELSLQQELLNGLQLNLSYEGRQSGGQEVIHLGRMMLQALF